uniref:Uncharacterized protein n=1 Tax=Musca domestica TaxID=7370 RepID=T1PMF7_MUSDO
MRAEEPKAEGQTVWEVLRTLSRKLMEDAVVIIEGNIQSTISNESEKMKPVDLIQGHISDEGVAMPPKFAEENKSGEQVIQGHSSNEGLTYSHKDADDEVSVAHISDEPKMRVPEDFRQAHISDDIEMTKLVDFFQGHSSDVGVRISPKNIFEDIFFPVFTTIFEMGAEKPKVEGKTDWEVLRTGLKKLMEVAVAIISNKDNEYQESGEENIPSTISSTVDFIQGHTSDDGLSISQEDDCYNDSDEEIVQGHILGISEFTHDLNSDEIGILKAIDHSPPIVNSEILDHAFLDYLDKFKLLLHQHQQMLPYYASHMRPLVNTAAQNNRDDNNSYMHEVLVKALSDSLKAILKEI